MTVTGNAYAVGSDYRCKYGTLVVGASYRTLDGALACRSPSQASAGAKAVEVALNGQQYSSSSISKKCSTFWLIIISSSRTSI